MPKTAAKRGSRSAAAKTPTAGTRRSSRPAKQAAAPPRRAKKVAARAKAPRRGQGKRAKAARSVAPFTVKPFMLEALESEVVPTDRDAAEWDGLETP